MARTLVIVVALLAGACGNTYGTEHELLSNFFRAARLRDSVVTTSLSSVAFEPHLAGAVQDFTITNVVHREGSELVTVDAVVRSPEGTTAPKQLVIMLEPATAEPGQTAGSRWMITSIR